MVESKQVMKKDKEAKKLEILEAEVLKRLRDTHLRQQQAIEELQDIFSKKYFSNMVYDPITQRYYQSSEPLPNINTDSAENIQDGLRSIDDGSYVHTNTD